MIFPWTDVRHNCCQHPVQLSRVFVVVVASNHHDRRRRNFLSQNDEPDIRCMHRESFSVFCFICSHYFVFGLTSTSWQSGGAFVLGLNWVPNMKNKTPSKKNRMNRRRRNRFKSCEYVRNITVYTYTLRVQLSMQRSINTDIMIMVDSFAWWEGLLSRISSLSTSFIFYDYYLTYVARVYEKHSTTTTIYEAVFAHVAVGVFGVLLHSSETDGAVMAGVVSASRLLLSFYYFFVFQNIVPKPMASLIFVVCPWICLNVNWNYKYIVMWTECKQNADLH